VVAELVADLAERHAKVQSAAARLVGRVKKLEARFEELESRAARRPQSCSVAALRILQSNSR
jgi:hypothetical protein